MELPIIPPEASSVAGQIDKVFYLLTALSVFFTLLVSVMIVFFVARYRRGAKVNRDNPIFGNPVFETGTAIFLAMVGLGVFWVSVKPFVEVYTPPADATEIFVIGKRWMWQLQHSNGIRENDELHLPLGRAIKLTLISQDVIHGFYVPAFRVKRDCLPGYYNTCWFRPTMLGKFPFFCTEYCGTNHSEMGGWVYVMKPDDYMRWKENNQTTTQKTETVAERGHDLFLKYQCSNCHTTQDGVHGPSLIALYGTNTILKNGQTVKVDDNFVRREIVNSDSERVAGYPNLMPTYSVGNEEGQLSEETILDLVAYIRSLAAPAAPPASTPNSFSSKMNKKTAKTTSNKPRRITLATTGAETIR